MNRFEKISDGQFQKDMMKNIYSDCMSVSDVSEVIGDINRVWYSLIYPRRATTHSSGYDIFAPVSFDLEPEDTIKIPTGFKCQVDEDKWLMIIPKSSMGFKHSIKLINQVGNIDSDYYNNKGNEGHIWVGLKNTSDKVWRVNKGDGIAQGIISQYFKTVDDSVDKEREGGFGSTS